MVERAIDIHRLNLEELLGVVSIYPWYAGARMELCSRMVDAGTLSDTQITQAAIYVWSRQILSDLVRKGRRPEGSEGEIREMLRKMMEQEEEVPEPEEEAVPVETPAEAARRVFVVGGDYFSSAQYREVRHDDDNIYSGFAHSDREFVPETQSEGFSLYTETLAQIYAEQGYYDEAKQIYSKLSLRYPEKSVYFASLIEKLDKN